MRCNFNVTSVCFQRKNLYLCSALVYHPYSRMVIKRESGANPEQSRCCKFHKMLQAITSMPLEIPFPGRRLKLKQVRRPAMHTFIIAFEEKALSLMKRTRRPPIISFTKLDSKKVNKLCQVYLMMSGRSDFARTFICGSKENCAINQDTCTKLFDP